MQKILSYSKWSFLFYLLFTLTNCSNKNLTGDIIKTKTPVFQLTSGGTISTFEYDEYAPTLVLLSNSKLALLYAYNGTCSGCTEGTHNIMLAISSSEFNVNAGNIPTFEEPQPLEIEGMVINSTDRIQFVATANGMGLQIYLNTPDLNSSKICNLSYTDVTVALTTSSCNPINNTDYEDFIVGGISADGNEIMAYDPNNSQGYVFNPSESASGMASEVEQMYSAIGALNIPETATGIANSWMPVFDTGILGAGSPSGIIGVTVSLALSLAENGLFGTAIAGFYSGDDAADFATFSANDGFSDDIYAITSHSLLDLWVLATETPDFDQANLPDFVEPPISCPNGYVLVLPNPTVGTSAPFCVAKFEMKDIGGAVSDAANTPWNQVTQLQAITECQNVGSGYHLITNAEWMTIARSIEANNVNWQGGFVGDGSLNTGHSDNTPASALAASSDDDPCSGTGQTCDTITWDLQKRTHELLSGEVIWDFSGNVEEWIDWQVSQSEKAYNSSDGAALGSIREWNIIDTETSLMPFSAFLPINTSLTSTAGIGTYLAGTQDPGAGTRGGAWNSGANAGIYTLSLASSSSMGLTTRGFRCAYSLQ